MSGGGGGDPFHEEEEHENHERYLITYADMITLLMALFIILFAIGQTDLEKFAKFREGIHQEFGAPPVLSGSGEIVDSASAAPAAVQVIATAEGENSGTPAEGDGEAADPGGDGSGVGGTVTIAEIEELVETLESGLAANNISGATVRADDRGVVVTLSTDDITFGSGSWQLQPAGVRAARAVAHTVRGLTNRVAVEGHTDDTPMTPPLTNWELSTNRADAVLRILIANGVHPDLLSASGYADTHPRVANDSDAARAANRRVEIIVIVPPTDAAPTPEVIEPLGPGTSAD